jgi:hypothetical protein
MSPSLEIYEAAVLAKRGHDKVRALLPELPTGLRRRLHDGAKCVSLMESDDNAGTSARPQHGFESPTGTVSLWTGPIVGEVRRRIA